MNAIWLKDGNSTTKNIRMARSLILITSVRMIPRTIFHTIVPSTRHHNEFLFIIFFFSGVNEDYSSHWLWWEVQTKGRQASLIALSGDHQSKWNLRHYRIVPTFFRRRYQQHIARISTKNCQKGICRSSRKLEYYWGRHQRRRRTHCRIRWTESSELILKTNTAVKDVQC